MQTTTKSILQLGANGIPVEVECVLSNGLPGIVIIGLGNKIIDEAKERIRSAFKSSGISFPRKRVILNLAPADIPKDSPSLDLALAIAILRAQGAIKLHDPTSAFIGELGLDGKIRSVRGIIGMLMGGLAHGIKHFYIPAANIQQASLVPNISASPVSTLKELLEVCQLASIGTELPVTAIPPQASSEVFDEIAGQYIAKRAICIAAAGGHNIFLSGPPGTGKSMLAKALPTLLPPMRPMEILEVSHLHSLTSHNYEQIIADRPFRAPHHSASLGAVVGGGSRVKPGEISLSHRGVLLLDEIPEFKRSVLEALRQPLEDREITISRVHDRIVFPADFILVATANPCPCGNYGTSKECLCPPYRVAQYAHKVSGPILDRIDLYATVESVDHSALLDTPREYSSPLMRAKITAARQLQLKRNPSGQLNASLANADIKKHAKLVPSARTFLDSAASKLNISARSYMRIVKVSRTIADLDSSERITVDHISEAFQFRKPPSESSDKYRA